MTNDVHKLGMLAQSRVTAGDLHAGAGTIGTANIAQAIKNFIERNINDMLGIFGEIAERAIEITALRHFHSSASNRSRAAENLVRREHSVHSLSRSAYCIRGRDHEAIRERLVG